MAFRNQLDRHEEVLKRAVQRNTLDLGLRHFDRAYLEQVRHMSERLHINVLGLATIGADVTPELARATIASISVLSALHASTEVKAAIAERIR